jgi:hypothetical protein
MANGNYIRQTWKCAACDFSSQSRLRNAAGVRAKSCHRRMTRVLVVACFAVLAGVAAPLAHADNVDLRFISFLDKMGILYDTPMQAIDEAKAVCSVLQQGGSVEDATRSVAGVHTGYSRDTAASFAGVAAAAYCPAYIPPPPVVKASQSGFSRGDSVEHRLAFQVRAVVGPSPIARAVPHRRVQLVCKVGTFSDRYHVIPAHRHARRELRGAPGR